MMTASEADLWAKKMQRRHRIIVWVDNLIDRANERVRAWRRLVSEGVCFECLSAKAESGRSGMCSRCDLITKQEWRATQRAKAA